MFGMHPKGTQFVQITQNYNLDFLKCPKSRQNQMNAREKQMITFENVSSTTNFNIFGLYSVFTKKSDHEVMGRYIYISTHLDPTT